MKINLRIDDEPKILSNFFLTIAKVNTNTRLIFDVVSHICKVFRASATKETARKKRSCFSSPPPPITVTFVKYYLTARENKQKLISLANKFSTILRIYTPFMKSNQISPQLQQLSVPGTHKPKACRYYDLEKRKNFCISMNKSEIWLAIWEKRTHLTKAIHRTIFQNPIKPIILTQYAQS